MNVIICGAGEVGSYLAEVLTEAGHDVTLVDSRPSRLRAVEETLDVRTLAGNSANADVLLEAGVEPESAVVAATSSDEVNVLTAAVGGKLGAGKTVARVHHSAYFDQRGLDYKRHLGIDELICPEYSTAQAIASTLRNPAALAIENFASGEIEMQEFPVSPNAPAIGRTLIELPLPDGVRLATIRRNDDVFQPSASTVIEAGDVVILVGNAEVFQKARRLFQKTAARHQRMVIMGGSALAVWLSRVLRDQAYSIRLFETDPPRAEELAEKLGWVTVMQADPTDLTVFEEERIAEADAFVGVTNDDEHNILGCAWGKSSGIDHVISVVQRPRYVHLIGRVGIDHAFSPRRVAAKEIERSLIETPLLRMASLAEGVVDVYRVRVKPSARAVGQPLRDLHLSPEWMIAAIQHGRQTRVPTAEDAIQAGDDVLVIGRHGQERKLKKLFGVG